MYKPDLWSSDAPVRTGIGSGGGVWGVGDVGQHLAHQTVWGDWCPALPFMNLAGGIWGLGRKEGDARRLKARRSLL